MDCLDSLNEAVRSAYGKGQVPGGGMTLSEYRAHYSVRPSCFARIPYGSR